MRILPWIIAYVLGTGAAMASPPPSQQESWTCQLAGSVEEMTQVQETIHRKPDNINYTPATVLSAEYQTVRLQVQTVSMNPDSRMPESSCPKEGKAWTAPIPLCDKGDMALGTTITGRIQRWYASPSHDFCLKLTN